MRGPNSTACKPPLRLDRRGFVMTSLGAGFAAAVLPVQAKTMITTDTQGLTAGEVKIPTKDGEGSIPAYRAQPAGKTGLPTVLVVQEIFGVHEHIKDVCAAAGEAGLPGHRARTVCAPGRRLDHERAGHPREGGVEGAGCAGDGRSRCDAPRGPRKMAAGGKLGITGFCWGGRIVWMYAAHNPSLAAGVAWYGNVATGRYPGDKGAIDVVDRIKAPVLGLYGAADSGIPNDTVEKMRAALKAAGNTRSEIILYPDTPHAFHADYRPSYRKEQAEDGWKRLTLWFKQYLA